MAKFSVNEKLDAINRAINGKERYLLQLEKNKV